MKNIYLILLFIHCFVQISLGQWVKQTNNFTENWGLAWSIDAADSNTVVLSADYNDAPSLVLLTKDAGISWKDISPFDKWGESIIDISIVDELNIWGATSKGNIYATSDGGENWTIQFYDTMKTEFMNYIKMFDENKGIAMGDGLRDPNSPPLILKTIDGGSNWVSTNDSIFGPFSRDTWRMIDFVNLECGYFYASGNTPNGMFKTLDSGNEWSLLSFPNEITHLIKFNDENLGLSVSFKRDSGSKTIGQTFFITENGGQTWSSHDNTSADLINDYPEDFEFIPNNPSLIWYLGAVN